MHALTFLAVAEGGSFNPFDPSGIGGLLWTWIIFLGALIPVWKLVMGPVTRALTERDARASEAIETAKRASEEAEAARAEVEVKLGEARAEAAALLSEARERAGVREKEIIDEAQGKSREMVEAARRAIQAEQDKAIAAIREEVVDLSLAGASAVLERNVGSDDDRRLVAGLVDKVGGDEMKGSTQ
jgi:F-type H+-transporting ATPase subunit b